MLVTYWRPPGTTTPAGWLRTSIGTWPRHSLEFWARTSPTYSSDASPTAASLSGQLWTTIARRRLTGASPWRAGRRHRTGVVVRLVALDPGSAQAAQARPPADHAPEVGQARGAPTGLGAARQACSPAENRPPARRRVQERLERPGELGLRDVPDDPRPFHDADLVVLLGDHDHHRVGLLGDPQCGPVARPESLRVDGGLRERQQRAGRQDRLVADDDRPVVKRGSGHEDRLEEIHGQIAVDHHPGLGDLLQSGLAFEDDEGAVTITGQQRRRPPDDLANPLSGTL